MVSKTINGATTRFLYDGADAVQEQNASGVPTANMLVGGTDTVFSRTDANGTRTLIHDGLGSAIGLLDSAGATQTSYSYEPFGATTQTGAASGNASKYTGREDDGTGLYYYRARYYSPTLQRFISEDPIGFAGGDTNLYAYVGNDPINNADPSGLCPECLPDPKTGRLRRFSDNRLVSNAELDLFQTMLGVAGMFPVVGEPFDALDTAMSAARGDCVGAGSGAASMIPGLGMGAGITKIGRRANNLADGLRLKKSLASAQQMGEAGRQIAGGSSGVPFRDASRFASEYGGNPNDWVKMSSSKYASPPGQGNGDMQLFETHWVENIFTGQRVEFKSKFPHMDK